MSARANVQRHEATREYGGARERARVCVKCTRRRASEREEHREERMTRGACVRLNNKEEMTRDTHK